MELPSWVFEVAHHMDLAPILLVIVLYRRGDDVPGAAWLLGFAWLVSWFGSSLQHFSGGEWWTSYMWVPVQMALVLAAVKPEWWIEAALGCLVVGVVSAYASAPGPEVLLSVAGSLAVLLLARGWVRLPLYLYFGLGTVCYLLMTQRTTDIVPAWSAYQVSRALAYLAFGVLLLAPTWREKWPSG